MTAWLNLIKKEWRQGIPALILPLVAYLIVAGIAAYFGSLAESTWTALLGVSFFATTIQVFYLVYYLLHSLNAERKKTHLWLHNPMPGYSLLSAKLVAGLFSMLITFFLTLTVLVVSLNVLFPVLPPWTDLMNFGLLGSIHIFLIALKFAAWLLFFWMIFLLFNRSLGTFISFLTTFILFIVSAAILERITNSAIYQTLTQWGQWGQNLCSELVAGLPFQKLEGSEACSEASAFYLGSYVFESVGVLLLFFAAAWILDRKVEV